MAKLGKEANSEFLNAFLDSSEKINLTNKVIENFERKIQSATDAVEKEELTRQKSAAVSQMLWEEERRNRTRENLNKDGSPYQGKTDDELLDAANKLKEAAKQQEESAKTFQKVSNTVSSGAKIVASLLKIFTTEMEKDLERLSASFDIMMADVKASGEKAIRATGLQTNAYTSAVGASISSWTGGINEAAYTSAAKLIDLQTQSAKLNLEFNKINLQAQNTKLVREAQQTERLNNLTAQQIESGVTAATETAKLVKDVTVGGTPIVGKKVEAAVEIGSVVAQTGVQINTAITALEGKRNTMLVQQAKDFSETQMDYAIQIKEKWIEAGAEVAKAWLDFAQKTEQNTEKSELAANDMGVGLGFSGNQLESYRKSMYDTQVEIARFGKRMEDAKNLQNTYSETSGRNIQLSTDDMLSSFALDKLAGKDGLSVELTAAMEPFKHSVEDSNEMFGEMFHNVNKIGLSGRKYLNDLTKNLKLAEKYQFKDGVKGLAEMSKWAQNVRFSMDSLSGILDKIQTGGLEGIVEQSANIQVLGGNFAMGADPLAMEYESYADPQGLAKRMNGMLRGLGVVNSATGEVTFSPSSQMRMRAFADAMGQDYGNVVNQVRQLALGDTISRNLNSNYKWTADEKALVTNKAQMKDGEWKVVMADNTKKAVADLTKEDIENLMPEGQEERGEKLVEYVSKILSHVEKMTGAETTRDAMLQQETRDTVIEEWNKRINNIYEDIHKNISEYSGNIKDWARFATQSQQTLKQIMEAGNTNVDAVSNNILAQGNNIAGSLGQVNGAIQDALSKMGVETSSANGGNNNASGGSNGVGDGNFLYGPNGSPTITKAEYDFLKKNDSYGRLDQYLRKDKKSDRYVISSKKGSDGLNGYQYINDNILQRNGLQSSISSIRSQGMDEEFEEFKKKAYKKYKKGINDHNIGGQTMASGGEIPEEILNYAEWADKIATDENIRNAGYAGNLTLNKVNDGLILQNGIPTMIDKDDQVMAAKNGGPIDRMVTLTQNILTSQKDMVTPRSMPYDSFVKENPYDRGFSNNSTTTNSSGEIKVAPIQINFNGKIELDGVGGTADITELVTKDPNFIRALSQMLSQEVEKQLNGGRSRDPYGPIV